MDWSAYRCRRAIWGIRSDVLVKQATTRELSWKLRYSTDWLVNLKRNG